MSWSWYSFLMKDDDQIRNSDWSIAEKNSKDWNTCVCSCVHGISKQMNGSPLDSSLQALGARFDFHIRYRQREKALIIYRKIMSRGRELGSK